MNWYYKNQIVDKNFTPPEGSVGFVYIITKFDNQRIDDIENRAFEIGQEDRKIYIGKKLLNSATKKKIGVRAQAKQLLETGDKRKIKKVIRGTKTSNWQSYWGSCKELVEDRKQSPELFRREILEFSYSKKHLSYLETKWQFHFNVLEIDSYNNHIQNWYRKDINKDDNR